MPSVYIDTKEYPTYGLPPGTTLGQVTQASLLVDTYLRRPEGLEYTPDNNGNPLYMSALTPTASLRVPAGLSPGTMVTATMTGPIRTIPNGGVVVVNKGQPNAEALAIYSMNQTTGVVTFANVVNSHTGSEPYDTGLVIFETKQLPTARPLMMLTKNPVVSLMAAQGRYGYQRRGAAGNYALNEFNLLAVMAQFGGPPVWENINLAFTDWNPETGQVWIPAGIMLTYYSEVRLSYVAGFIRSAIPPIIKIATANLVRSQSSSPLQGNMKLIKAGDTTMERFMDTLLDADTRAMLSPYRARNMA